MASAVPRIASLVSTESYIAYVTPLRYRYVTLYLSRNTLATLSFLVLTRAAVSQTAVFNIPIDPSGGGVKLYLYNTR